MNAQKIIEALVWSKEIGEGGGDFEPLITVMDAVAEEIGNSKLSKRSGRKLWIEVMKDLQLSGELEHNQMIPCRYCDTAFEPVVSDQLLDLFLAWRHSQKSLDLLLIHRCQACGGKLETVRSCKYDGDFYTPRPGSIVDDVQWTSSILYGSSEMDDE